MTLITILGIAFLVSLVISGAMIFAGVGDVPEARSSHKTVTPTSGGLGIVAALGAATFLMVGSGAIGPQFGQVLSLIWAIGFLGLMDDILNLAAGFKFFFVIVISIAAVWTVGPVTTLPFGGMDINLPIWFSWLGSFLWVFVVVNIVNFLDGSNGLMIVVMSIASAVLASIAFAFGASDAGIVLLILVAGILGLAPFNLRPSAKIFAGDVGSLTIGFTYAVAVLWMCSAARDFRPVYLGPVLILPFLADSLFTMARRARRGENLMTAHRSHLYQRMIAFGYSHMRVALIYGAMTFAIAGISLWTATNGIYRYLNFLLFPSLLMLSVYMLAGRRFR